MKETMYTMQSSVRESYISHTDLHTKVIKLGSRKTQFRGTVCHRTYDKAWTSRVSSTNWKHFCLGISQPRRIV